MSGALSLWGSGFRAAHHHLGARVKVVPVHGDLPVFPLNGVPLGQAALLSHLGRLHAKVLADGGDQVAEWAGPPGGRVGWGG